MPRNTREWSRRELDAAKNNLDWAGKHLYGVLEVYQATHPEISGPISEVLMAILELDKVIERIRVSY